MILGGIKLGPSDPISVLGYVDDTNLVSTQVEKMMQLVYNAIDS